MKTKDIRAELKSVNDSGRFEGYASIFGNVDDGQDLIHAGAFKEIVTNSSGRVVTLYMHGFKDPIGLAKVGQDSKGLAFEAELEMGDPTAQRAHRLMKAQILDGMSIGYDVLDGGATWNEKNVRELSALKLWEISPVTFGMNPLARIEGVKTASEIKTIRDFEAFLRDAGGFDRARAKALASGGWDALLKVRDEPAGEGKVAAQIAELFEGRLFNLDKKSN
jgi:HK97 family phage prohead protease